ncbi:MAG: class I SAM-dependent methyltransferase [Burkholderiales bacterium]|nr:class I SAM-dependent methyltransferase [Burkholderiales bacterium]
MQLTQSMADLLLELEQFGAANDRDVTDRPRRMLNITRDTGEFLHVMMLAAKSRDVLEIGTSNGYSTLWLALAAQTLCGHVTTVEQSAYKLSLAARNFARSGLAEVITQLQGDAGLVLEAAKSTTYDLVFLDSERREYLGWWPQIKRVLRPGGVLVVDNAVSHAADLADFMACVKADAEFSTCLLPVGNGEFVATRLPDWG